MKSRRPSGVADAGDHETVVVAAAHLQQLGARRRRAQQPFSVIEADDLVVGAVCDEHRHAERADALEVGIVNARQPAHRQERVELRADVGDRGECGLDHQRRGRHPAGQPDGDRGTQRAAVQDDAPGRHMPRLGQMTPGRHGVAVGSVLTGLAAAATVAAIVEHQHAVPHLQVLAQRRQPVAHVAGVAVREQHHGCRLVRRRHVPRMHPLAVLGAELERLEGSTDAAGIGARHLGRHEHQLLLEPVQSGTRHQEHDREGTQQAQHQEAAPVHQSGHVRVSRGSMSLEAGRGVRPICASSRCPDGDRDRTQVPVGQ